LSEPPVSVRTGRDSSPAPFSVKLSSAQSEHPKKSPTASAPKESSSGQTTLSSTNFTAGKSRTTPTPHQNPPAAKSAQTSPPSTPPNAQASVTITPTSSPQPATPEQKQFNDVLRSLDAYDKQTDEPAARSSSGWLTGLWLVVKLAMVVGLIYLSVFALKVMLTKKPLTFGLSTKGDIKVLETVMLGPNRALHLVAIGEQRLLLASTANAVRLICDVDDSHAGIAERAVNHALSATSSGTSSNGSAPQFASALLALKEVMNPTEVVAEPPAGKKDGRSMLREKILKLRESSH
jgi:flagellar biogenesis protein FliO